MKIPNPRPLYKVDPTQLRLGFWELGSLKHRGCSDDKK